MNANIIDLTSGVDLDVEYEGVKRQGPFHTSPDLMSTTTVRQRAADIAEEIGVDPTVITFFVNNNWQSFVIVEAIAQYFNLDPRVIIIGYGAWIDVSEYYQSSRKGGDVITLVKEERQSNKLLGLVG